MTTAPIDESASPEHSPGQWRAAVWILISLALIRIASTYTVFSETVDEANHTAPGLHILTTHQFDGQLANPPLPTIAFAVGPWLAGVQFDGTLRSIFHTGPGYRTALTLARVGNLVFFVIAALGLWAWARLEIGEKGAFIALLLFTIQPMVIGHAGLATHDMAATAGTVMSLLAFSRWLAKPTVKRAAIVGVAYGFAILCKFSTIPYVSIACAAVWLVRVMRDDRNRAQVVRRTVTLSVILIVTPLVVWAGYAFTTEPAAAVRQTLGRDAILAPAVAHLTPSFPVPAPKFLYGLNDLLQINRGGHPAYFFGEQRMKGWVTYFPTAFALKTTLPVLLLLLLGFVFARGVFLESMLAAAAILAFAMTAHLDIGLRYVLPIYAPLALAGAATAVAMLRHKRKLLRAAAIVIVAADFTVSALAHPDYFPYFNLIAGPDPSQILIDSNLDWGQDFFRLSREARKLKIDQLGFSVLGGTDLDRAHLPRSYRVHPSVPTQGWIAVSDHSYRMTGGQGGWRWLKGRKYRRIGKTIRLYYVP